MSIRIFLLKNTNMDKRTSEILRLRGGSERLGPFMDDVEHEKQLRSELGVGDDEECDDAGLEDTHDRKCECVCMHVGAWVYGCIRMCMCE